MTRRSRSREAPRTTKGLPHLPIRRRATLVNALLDWFRRHGRDLPWRHTLDPYAIWVSEIMLQQTQVKTVIPYWERWMARFPTLTALARANPEAVLKHWEGLGYYSRARNLQAAARKLVQEHQGRFPTDHAEVLDLPGVGPYTAGAVCSLAFNQPTPVLDGNVERVLTRLGAVRGDPRETGLKRLLWQTAGELVALAGQRPANHPAGLAGNCSALNQALMELGATLCTPQSPRCTNCPVAKDCQAFRAGEPERYPELRQRVPTTARQFAAFVLEQGGRVWIVRRPAGVVNAKLWEFPNTEITSFRDLHPLSCLRQGWGLEASQPHPLAVVRHSITRYRLEVQAHWCQIDPPARQQLEAVSPPRRQRPEMPHGPIPSPWTDGIWVNAEEGLEKPFTAAHRRLFRAWVERTGNVGGLKSRQPI